MEKAYRTKPLDADNRRDPNTNLWCVKCHKDLDPKKNYRYVHIVDGGHVVLHAEDEEIYNSRENPKNDDLGSFPIGNDCAKKLGTEWTS